MISRLEVVRIGVVVAFLLAAAWAFRGELAWAGYAGLAGVVLTLYAGALERRG